MGAQEFFDAIHAIWRPLADELSRSTGRRYRVIPFCTRFVDQPTALVIGTNHSDFSPGDPTEAAKIADLYEAAIPADSTLLVHNHVFAKRLRQACTAAGIEVDENWMGTNRYAIQTGPDGPGELTSCSQFKACRQAMDHLLRTLVETIHPLNVLLVGKHAQGLYFSQDGKPKALLPRSVNLIPVPHPSMAYNCPNITAQLSTYFIRKKLAPA
jgi:hypothetical protein